MKTVEKINKEISKIIDRYCSKPESFDSKRRAEEEAKAWDEQVSRFSKVWEIQEEK